MTGNSNESQRSERRAARQVALFPPPYGRTARARGTVISADDIIHLLSPAEYCGRLRLETQLTRAITSDLQCKGGGVLSAHWL